MIARWVCIFLIGGFAAGVAPGAEVDVRLVERYRELLEARPEPGVVLERLWEAADREALLAEYSQRAESGDAIAALVLGHLLEHAGRTADALEAFLKAAESDPSRSDAWEAAATLARETGDTESAALYLDRAETVLNVDDVEGRVRIATKRGQILAGLGKTDEAAEAWESAMAADPANGTLREALVEQYMRAGMWDAARKHLEILATSRSPEVRVGALQQLALLEVERGDAAAALQVLESALDLTAPGNWMRSGIVRDLARIAQNADLATETFSRWAEQAEQQPEDADRSLRLVELAAALGDVAGELKWMERYLERHPELPEIKPRRAILLGALGRHAEAAVLQRTLWEASPQDAALAFALAESEIQAGNVDPAMQVLEQWGAHGENAHGQIAGFLRKNNLQDPLEKLLVRQAEAYPDNADAVIELVEFYAEQGDMERAAAVLEPHADQEGDLLARGVRVFLASDELEMAKRFLDLGDDAPGLMELRGELEERAGNFPEAVAHFEQAMALSADPESVDRRIWNVLRSWEDAESGTAVRRLPWEPEPVDIRAIMEGTEKDAASAQSPTQDYLQKITAAASEPADWVRVAEWNLRAGNYVQSVDAASKALAVGADPVKVRGILAQAAMSQVEPELAMEQLRLLIEEDPEGAAHYREELAKLVAVESGPDVALALLASDGAGSKIAQAEVLQNSQRWYEAVDAWKALLPEVTAGQRARVIEQLVVGLERTGRADEGVELLWKEVVAHPPGSERAARKAALGAFAGRHGMTALVAGRFMDAVEHAPRDVALQLETASALRMAGDADAARAMLPAIYRTAGSNVTELQALAAEAVALGDGVLAARVQRQIISQTPSPEVADFEKLAAQQLGLLDVDAAVSTYREMIARYPRNADALVEAAAFFEKLGRIHEALPLRRKVAELAPGDVSNTRELGEWLLIRGEHAEAMGLWESVLERPSRRDVDELVLPPVPPEVLQQMRVGGHIAARSRGLGYVFAVAPPSPLQTGGVLAQDLEAVAHLAMLKHQSGDAESLNEWLEEMRTKDASMAAWALYYAGRGSEFGRLVFEELKEISPSDEAIQKTIWLALETGGAEAVGAWMVQQTESDARETVLNGLRNLAQRMPEAITVELMAQLFPPEMEDAETLWQAALLCAGVARYEAAMQPGMRVLELSRSNQATYAYELAMWALWRGDKREALRLLRLCLDGSIEGFASVPAAAWRAYFLLLPVEDRADFAESASSLLGERMDSGEGDLVLALMEGLQGRNDLALEHLRRRQSRGALSATPDGWGNASDEQAMRYWNQLFTSATRLEEWGMYPLARDLLDLTLADQARIRLHGQAAAAVIAECRLRATSLGVMEYALAEPEFAETGPALPMLEFSTRQMDQLESFGMLRFGLPATERALEVSPTDQSVIFAYLKAARAAGQFVEPGRRVREILATQEPGLPERVQISLGLAFLWEQFGQWQEVVDLLEPLAETSPAPMPVITQLAHAHEALGNAADAHGFLVQMAEHPEATMLMRLRAAEILLDVDQTRALEMARALMSMSDPVAAARLMELFAAADSAVDVGNFLKVVSTEGNPAVVTSVLEVLAEDLPDVDRRGVLMAAMVQSPERSQQAELFKLYVKTLGGEVSMEDVKNLHSVFLRAGQSEAEVFRFLLEHLKDDELLARCMEHAESQHASGVAGLEFALAEWYSRTGEAEKLAEVVKIFLERPNLSRRSLSLILESLRQHEQPAWAAAVAKRLIEDFADDIPGHAQHLVFLQKNGQPGESLEHLELLRAWVIANPAVPGEFAKEFENQSLIPEAEIMLDDANRMASPAHALQVAKERLEFFIRTGQVEKLKAALPRFIRQFGPRDDVPLILSYLEVVNPESGARPLEGLTPDFIKALNTTE